MRGKEAIRLEGRKKERKRETSVFNFVTRPCIKKNAVCEHFMMISGFSELQLGVCQARPEKTAFCVGLQKLCLVLGIAYEGQLC